MAPHQPGPTALYKYEVDAHTPKLETELQTGVIIIVERRRSLQLPYYSMHVRLLC